MDPKQSSKEKESNQKQLAALSADLVAPKATSRLRAAEQLGEMPTGDLESLIALERCAIRDSKKEIRLAALSALGSPTYDLLSRRRTHLTLASRKLILSQIEVWIDEGILPAPLAEALQQRYAPSVSQRLGVAADRDCARHRKSGLRHLARRDCHSRGLGVWSWWTRCRGQRN